MSEFGSELQTRSVVSVRARIGSALRYVAYTLYGLLGLVGFIMCCGIVAKAWGLLATFAAVFFCPVTFLAVPLYAGFAQGNWWPLIVNYGGTVVCALIYGVALLLGGWEDE
jgi:hypothetical protein